MSGFLEAQHGDMHTSGCRELQVAARDGDIAYLVPSPERTTSVYRWNITWRKPAAKTSTGYLRKEEMD
jgi:hypothetical protein